MAEYINRDDVLDLSYCPASLTWDNLLAESKSVVDVEDINSIPTADVAEVKHGKWIICCDGYYPYCSECGYEPPWASGRDMRTNYCPQCGAKMDGGEE